MTPIEALEAAVEAGDAARVEQLLEGLSEAERKKAASRMAELYRQHFGWLDPGDGRYELKKGQMSASTIAVLGTGSLAQAKKVHFPSQHSVYGVLANRKPEWLADWAESTFERESYPYFRDIRRLIRNGILPKPSSDNYVLAVIGSLLEPLEQLVEREPDLLDYEIWRIFEVEGNPRTSLANHDKYFGGWAKGLAGLAAKGVLPRARLLDASLDALERDFSPYRAAWFSSFHEMLAPEAAEVEQHATRYLGLLGSRVPSTVSFAMRAVARLEKTGRLEPSVALPLLGPALAARQKGVVIEALKVLDSICRRAPETTAESAALAASALAHDSPEVHKRAVDLMEAGGTEAAALVRGYEELLAPTQRARLGVTVEAAARVMPADNGPVPLPPISGLDELVEVYAAILENAGPPEDIERVLDGVSRLCVESSVRFTALTAPLAVRAEKFLAAPRLWPVTNAFDGRWDPRFSLSALALAWIRKEPARPGKACHGLASFLTARVAEIAVRAADGVGKPLAGLPSHTESWLDPRILVERLHQHPEPDRCDLIQALLRLSGSDREQALEQARSLPGPTGRIVRFALGSDDCRRPPRFYDAALWEAAGQARDPEGGAGVHRLRWFAKTYEVYGKPLKRMEVEMESWPSPEMDSAKPAALTAIPGTQDAAMLRWCGTVWPANRESWFAAGALALGQNLDWDSAVWANRVYLDTLAAYRGAYGPMAYQLLALGLGCKETGEGIAASDALVAGLGDGRVNGKRLGETCAKLASEGMITFSRWVKRFAAVSRLHTSFARELRTVMDRLLASRAPVGAKELAGFLELLCELCAQTGVPLSAEAREYLASLQPGGKAGRYAGNLLRSE